MEEEEANVTGGELGPPAEIQNQEAGGDVMHMPTEARNFDAARYSLSSPHVWWRARSRAFVSRSERENLPAVGIQL